MRKQLKVTATEIAFFASFTSLCCTAYGETLLAQKTNSSEVIPTKTAQPCNLTLALSKDWNINHSEVPVVTNFSNPGPYTLSFWFYADPLRFQIEFQPAQAGAAMGKKWVTLVPYPPPSNGRPIKILTRDIVGSILPGERWTEKTNLAGFSTSAEGFYRITANEAFPQANQFKGSADNPRDYQKIVINVFSNPVVVRRTKTKFIEVDIVTGKQVAPK